MTYKEFVYEVAIMRQAQRDYFKTRDPQVLRRCKWEEKAVDLAILDFKKAFDAAGDPNACQD